MQVQCLGWEGPLEEAQGKPLQNSCLENPMARGAWRATVHGVAESDMTEALSACVNLNLESKRNSKHSLHY